MHLENQEKLPVIQEKCWEFIDQEHILYQRLLGEILSIYRENESTTSTIEKGSEETCYSDNMMDISLGCKLTCILTKNYYESNEYILE